MNTADPATTQLESITAGAHDDTVAATDLRRRVVQQRLIATGLAVCVRLHRKPLPASSARKVVEHASPRPASLTAREWHDPGELPHVGFALRKETPTMLYTLAVVLLMLWLLGLVSSYTMGGFIHILLVVAIVMVLLRLISGRKVV